MARILYGISGVGRGHGSRSRLVIDHLIEVGHDVQVVTWGNGNSWFLNKYKVRPIKGWKTAFKEGSIDYLKTARHGASTIFRDGAGIWRTLCDALNEHRPQLAISDFEPFVSGICTTKGVPVISVDHVHVISNCKLHHPDQRQVHNLIAGITSSLMANSARHFFITSFYFPEVKEGFKTKQLWWDQSSDLRCCAAVYLKVNISWFIFPRRRLMNVYYLFYKSSNIK